MTTPDRDQRFRLALTPGMQPTAWTRTWADRLPDRPLDLVQVTDAEAGTVLLNGTADAALLRLPVDRDRLHAIPLFTEVTVLVLPKDHLLTALDRITPADLVEETLITPADDVLRWTDPPGEPSLLPTPETTADAVELVAAGVGLLAVPMSLARLHHRKDLTYRPLIDAPDSQAALAWTRAREDDPLIEELIGIIRGRTANSSRGRAAEPPATRTEPKKRTPPPARTGRETSASRRRTGRPGGGTARRRGR
ncbi:LysR family transcriptional regulator substrate-binding protein [Cellulomonas sp. RIT-PI-Y]|uniref:LysR family transcriptional regulator substrate-binding protein n=1 Tax=Cellulomonas sp. RIT-PI-Y TaxID=3035297 RepID=UPI0021DAF9AD|nr:LysR family transcriptional regulator substrate-binding protein [Cellulomonas sp. RIT-PI-Y]